MKIAIFLIATGKYFYFFRSLYRSCERYLFRNMKKYYFLFTDSNPPPYKNIIHIPRTHRGFPADSLYRYHYFMEIQEQVKRLDIELCYYFDMDSRMVTPIGSDFWPTHRQPLIAVFHPGCYGNRTHAFRIDRSLPFERREASTACVRYDEKAFLYVYGAVQGGFTSAFFEAAQSMQQAIDIDDKHDITAVWHDESHWNRYVLSHLDKVRILPPDYGYPVEGTRLLRNCRMKIVALDKDIIFSHLSVKNIRKSIRVLFSYLPLKWQWFLRKYIINIIYRIIYRK